ncbi:hypothetical protein METBIDRAFT_219238 [Metschnikowia bicuspidata var. bicuspidata NRRL YB-4993]|uniref:Uncharacterized protein n=1 Tax=Metschnikowia bicuspidata var. bicuspidata NRRL YB-4993 TaxID=869754 RepID=A0A1A0H5D1_9ASCO|nr:hypothetical protein METBIDRAFT_219238 [Metschnikowia bicuspidata var. bicuspidata NRRL YB-4993]OBA19128.1 hypothetical protein METBIDRAFT_219238 [Metschnikowia bicuspidata var. bicuspidata NRRL YB-4993]
MHRSQRAVRGQDGTKSEYRMWGHPVEKAAKPQPRLTCCSRLVCRSHNTNSETGKSCVPRGLAQFRSPLIFRVVKSAGHFFGPGQLVQDKIKKATILGRTGTSFFRPPEAGLANTAFVPPFFFSPTAMIPQETRTLPTTLAPGRRRQNRRGTRNSLFVGGRSANRLFSRRGAGSLPPEHGPGDNWGCPGDNTRGPGDNMRGPGDNTRARDNSASGGPPQVYVDILTDSSSSQLSMFSFEEPASSAEPSEYDDYFCSNTLDADSGRRLQALQTSMCNPDLSPSVRSVLETAFRQFDKQSARTLETLPPYSHDCKPPPYLV